MPVRILSMVPWPLFHAHCIQRVFPNLVPSLHSHPHKRQGAPLPPTQEPLPPTQEAGGSTLIYTRAWGSTPTHTRGRGLHSHLHKSMGLHSHPHKSHSHPRKSHSQSRSKARSSLTHVELIQFRGKPETYCKNSDWETETRTACSIPMTTEYK